MSKVLAESYEKISNYEKSIIYYKELISARDSLHQNQIKIMNANHDFKIRMIENKNHLNNNLDSNRFWMILTFMALFLNMVLIILIYVLHKRNPTSWNSLFHHK